MRRSLMRAFVQRTLGKGIAFRLVEAFCALAMIPAVFVSAVTLSSPSIAFGAEKDGFVYEVGGYVDGGAVGQGSASDAYGLEPLYGCEYRVLNGDEGDNNAAQLHSIIDCGQGVYITDYKGSLTNVKVPDKIDGVDVVYAAIGKNDYDRDCGAVDVSSCRSLKCIELSAPRSVKTGDANAALIDFRLTTGKRLVSLNLDALVNLDRFFCYDSLPAQISINKSKLRFFGLSMPCVIYDNEDESRCAKDGLSNLDLTGASKLEMLYINNDASSLSPHWLCMPLLNLTGCTQLKYVDVRYTNLANFDTSDFPALSNLCLANNCIPNAVVDDLAQQCQARGISFSAGGQFIGKRLPGSISLQTNSFAYDGAAKCPPVIVPGLKEGRDYTVVYENNVRVGQARAIVCGINEYRGSMVEKPFVISAKAPEATTSAAPVSLAKATVTVKSRTWTGKMLRPTTPVVRLGGRTLRDGVDYTWSCRGGKAVGSYKVSVAGKGSYAGSTVGTFKILPKATTVSKLSGGKKAFTVKWKALPKVALRQVAGYQVRYSTSKKFSSKTTKVKTVKSSSPAGKKRSLTVRKLKDSKKYYVQVRTYKKVGGATFYSAWSKAKPVRIKKQ